MKLLSLLLASSLTLAAHSTALAEVSTEPKSIVVFGATGVIGQSIVAEALSLRHDVTCVSLSPGLPGW